jgi:hypothetical protein
VPLDRPENVVTDRPSLASLRSAVPFVERHVGPDEAEVATMLAALAGDDADTHDLDSFLASAVPSAIRHDAALQLPPALDEAEALAALRDKAARNAPGVSMIGLGYSPTTTPAVIRRNVLENPAWYTAYTPYQPEISQGRLEALLTFQTMVADLTGLPTANASLLDEGTAAAEAITLVRRANRAAEPGPFVVDADSLPQTLAVVRTRAEAMGLEILVTDLDDGLPDGDLAGVLIAYPGASGAVRDPRPVIEQVHGRGGLAVVTTDPLALLLLEGPWPSRRRRRGGLQPALRCADVLRRSACGVHGRALGPRAPPAWPARRGVPRRRGASGVPLGLADPRAAHPPRQGHLEHLHRPGAVGGHSCHVRGAPRTQGPAPGGRARSPLGRRARGRAG